MFMTKDCGHRTAGINMFLRTAYLEMGERFYFGVEVAILRIDSE